MTDHPQHIRLDKWLYHARFFKSRTLASKFCQGGGFRINSELSTKSHAEVRVGDVLTFNHRGRVRVIQVEAVGTRRGPALEAQALYQDLSPDALPSAKKTKANDAMAHANRAPGQGRPTKAERRATDKLKADLN